MRRKTKAMQKTRKELPGTLLFLSLVLAIMIMIALQDSANDATNALTPPASDTETTLQDTRLVDSGSEPANRVE